MAGAFGTIDWVQTRNRDFYTTGAAISVEYGAAESTMPAGNVLDPHPGTRARFVPSLDKFAITLDLGQEREVGVIAVVNTTTIGVETLTVYGSNTDPTGFAGEVIAATSVVAEAPDRNRGQWIVLLPADVSVRYVRLRWTDLGASYFDVGRIAIMQTIRLERGLPFGSVEGRLPGGARDVNPYTGTEHRVAGLVQRRFARFTLPRLTSSEYAGSVRNMLADINAADDVLWIPDTGLAQAELHERCILGGIVTPGQEIGITRNTPVSGSASFSIVERA